MEAEFEVEIMKEEVVKLLKERKAVIEPFDSSKQRSHVWKVFGKVRLNRDRYEEMVPRYCKGVVACSCCLAVYTHKGRSHGTSTLKGHKCVHLLDGSASLLADLPGSFSEQEVGSPEEPLPSTSASGMSAARKRQQEQHLPCAREPILTVEETSPKSAPPRPQLLCVRWGNYDSNLHTMFTQLLTGEHFVDVTLTCEGRSLKCHKVVLSACSSYFEKLLTENPCPHPIVFLKDMKFWEVEALIDFMYRGEVNIPQEKLSCLLKAAESLQVRGLGSSVDNQGVQEKESNGFVSVSSRGNGGEVPPRKKWRREVAASVSSRNTCRSETETEQIQMDEAENVSVDDLAPREQFENIPLFMKIEPEEYSPPTENVTYINERSCASKMVESNGGVTPGCDVAEESFQAHESPPSQTTEDDWTEPKLQESRSSEAQKDDWSSVQQLPEACSFHFTATQTVKQPK